jgi:nitrate/nitrite-specific signal transduction histidine kinase
MRLILPRTTSIKRRSLVYFVLIVMLTAVVISGVNMVLGTRDARNRVVGQLKSVVTLKEQEISSWTGGLRLNLDIALSEENVQQDLRTLTQTSASSDAYRTAHARVQQRFIWAANRMGLFEELFFMDDTGTVLLSTAPGHERERLGINDYFIEGLKSPYLQQPSFSLSLGEMTVVASAPVITQEGTLGVIAGRASLASLNKIMIERAGLGNTGETYLVGSNRRLLTELRAPGFSIPDTYVLTAGADAAIDTGGAGYATYAGYAGNRVIGVYDWLPTLKVALIAEQGEGEALHSTGVALITTGGVALLAVVLAILAGIVLTRTIVRPLAELGATAGRITAGDLDVTAEVVREDEIGALAHSFNRMTAQLRGLVRNLERRTDHLRAINEAGRHISSILELDELLPYVARSLLETFDYESVRILLLDDANGRLLTCGRRECEEVSQLSSDNLDDLPIMQSVTSSGESVLWSDSVATEPSTEGGPTGGGESRSEIAVPIRVGENLVGVLDLISAGPHALDEQDLFAAQTLAAQLAIAIENSRLYHQADELAASRERQRLARDLHDAVSQTLFSSALIADVLPRIWEKNSDEGRRRLEELRQLTRGALAEMRALLLELRPAALEQGELGDLLRQLSEAITGRARVPVTVNLAGHATLPPEVQVGLYRIAQEALNNVAKHAAAGSVTVDLRSSAGEVLLSVSDDGRGYDPEDTSPDHLGVSIMGERAEAIGAELRIESQPGQGTRVMVTWQPDNPWGARPGSRPSPGSASRLDTGNRERGV